MPLETHYYEVYNQPNVALVDIKHSPIERITPDGIKTRDSGFSFDIMIYATGFDAITGSFDRIDIRGRDGQTLKAKWAHGPQTFLGVQVEGFPNMFMLMGPHTALGNIPRSIEYNVEWVANLIGYMRQRRLTRADALPQAVAAWTDHVKDVGEGLLSNEVDSWMTGINSISRASKGASLPAIAAVRRPIANAAMRWRPKATGSWRSAGRRRSARAPSRFILQVAAIAASLRQNARNMLGQWTSIARPSLATGAALAPSGAGRKRLAWIAFLGAFVLAPSIAAADWLSTLVGTARRVAAEAPSASTRALDKVAAHVRAPASQAGRDRARGPGHPEGHWRFVSKAGETITAGTPAEMRRVASLLVPEAKAEARLNSILPRTRCLPAVPPSGPARGSELHLFAGEESYRILRRSEGPNERLFAEIRSNLVVAAERGQAVCRGRLAA